MQGGDRRAAADAGVLRQHRRRRADGAAGLLGAASTTRPTHHVGVKFSTNGVRITPEVAGRLAASDYVDVQISLDGATAEVNDAVRGPGSFAMAITRAGEPGRRRASPTPRSPSSSPGRTSISSTSSRRWPTRYGATLRLTRLRPSGRGADVWDELHPTAEQQRAALRLAGRPRRRTCSPATRSSISPAFGERALPGLNLCGAGRVVCLIDPVGDVYACPFAIHDEFLAGNMRVRRRVRQRMAERRELFAELREPQIGRSVRAAAALRRRCRGGCMAAKFFTGLPLDGPDPECVQGYGEPALARERRTSPAAEPATIPGATATVVRSAGPAPRRRWRRARRRGPAMRVWC